MAKWFSKGLVAIVAAIAFAVAAPSPARATVACNPSLSSFPAIFPDVVVGTGGTLTFTQSQLLTTFQQVGQIYCGVQNGAQGLLTNTESFSQWSQNGQSFYTGANGTAPSALSGGLVASVFNEGPNDMALEQQLEAQAESPLGETAAIQDNTTMNSLLLDTQQKMLMMQATNNVQNIVSTQQGASAYGQDLDLNSNPNQGWNY